MTLIIFTILIMIMIMTMTITLTNHKHHISNLDMLPLGTFFKKKLPHNKTNKTKQKPTGAHPIHPSLRFGGLYPKRLNRFRTWEHALWDHLQVGIPMEIMP